MTALANAVRTKTGRTDTLTLDEMASGLNGIPEKGSADLIASGATVSVPAGNYKESVSKSVATTTQATPSISIDSAGKITATSSQEVYYEDVNKTKLTDWDVIGSTEFNEYNGGTTTTGEEVGVINEDNSISLTGTSLATGTYTMYYENADGVKLEGWDSIGTVNK